MMGGCCFSEVKYVLSEPLNCELMGLLLPITNLVFSAAYKTAGKIVKSLGKVAENRALCVLFSFHLTAFFFLSSHLPSFKNQHEGSLCYVGPETWTLPGLS